MYDIMVITIDGYDGTGKTTLAKALADKYNFLYVEKPIIKMAQQKNKISYEEAEILVKSIENRLFSDTVNNRKQIANFYCNALSWLRQFENKCNIILDRGMLTTYAVIGYSETQAIFDEYIKRGAFFTASIYLTADDEERVRRIYKRDPNDPDLKYPIRWRENNLEEFASRRGLNYCKIDTNNKTLKQVFEQADIFFKKQINPIKENDWER